MGLRCPPARVCGPWRCAPAPTGCSPLQAADDPAPCSPASCTSCSVIQAKSDSTSPMRPISSSRCASKPADTSTSCGRNCRNLGSHRAETSSRIAAPRVRGHGLVQHVAGPGRGATERIERVLEKTAHQHAFVARQRRLGAVAVVHVEIHDRDTRQSVVRDGMARGNRHIAQEAKPMAWSGQAWWPGGRTAQNADSPSPASTASTAAMAAPAACRAAV